MNTILCYGDSNTWGWDPEKRTRFPLAVRWTGRLATLLGDSFRVVEEGLPGRTTVHDDPIEGAHMNGRTTLLPCLLSHRPLDLVVLMLGTNDLKARFASPAPDIAAGAGLLVQDIRGSGCGPGGAAPAVLLVAPPPILSVQPPNEKFEGGPEKSRRFGELFAQTAGELNVAFLDAGGVVPTSRIDGVHWDAGAHYDFAMALAGLVPRVLG